MFYLKGCWKKFVKDSVFKLQLLTHRRSQAHIAINISYAFRYKIGSLQVSIHVVQNQHIGKQKSRWDKKNKGNYHLKLCMPFVGLAPVRLLRPNMPVLYYVNGNLQRAYCTFCTGLWPRNSQKRLEHKENRELLKVIILSGRYPYTEWFYLNRETNAKQKVPNSKR